MNHSTPGLPVHHQLPEFTQIHVHQVRDAIQPAHPLSSPSPPAPIPPSIRVFSNESALCMRWPKYWSFSFSISPSNEHPGLISFRMDSASPCSPRDSQESSPTPQFKSINSLALSLRYSPTLTSIQEKAMATHSSTLPWKIPWKEEPGRLQAMGSLRVGHNRTTSLSHFHFHVLEKEMATHSSVLALENPMDREAWQDTVHRVIKSQIQLQ